MTGILYGIGLGPGDHELVTVKAANLLAKTSVIAYLTTKNGKSFARSIAAPYLSDYVQEIIIPLVMQEGHAVAEQAYDCGAEAIAGCLENGRDVAVLCPGDPLLYGSFIYIMKRLLPGFTVRVVPGVYSVAAAGAALGLALAKGEESVSILSASWSDERLESSILAANTVAILKVGRHGVRIRALLKRLCLLSSSWYVAEVSLPGQHLCRFDLLGEQVMPYFSLVIVRRHENSPLVYFS